MARTRAIWEPESAKNTDPGGGQMVATAQQESVVRPKAQELRNSFDSAGPILAAVEPSTVQVAADTAARLAQVLDAPLVFIYVRRPPPAILGNPQYQQRLTKDMVRGRKTLDKALAVARRRGVVSYGEIKEGDAAKRIVEVARARRTQFVVVGRRRRRFRPSVSRRVIRSARQPVVVAVAPVNPPLRSRLPRRVRLIKTRRVRPLQAHSSCNAAKLRAPKARQA
jgi:nucleotide-binding universal stress UspA family protein